MTTESTPPKLQARILSAAEYADWDALVASSPSGSIYSTSTYLSSLCAVSEATFKIVVVERKEEILGGVALYQVNSIAGYYVAPRLLLYYNGIVFKQVAGSAANAISVNLTALETLAEFLKSQGYLRLELNNRSAIFDVRAFQAQRWTTSLNYTYLVSIKDLEELWSRIDKNLRRLIRRAQENNLVFSDDDDFDSFFELHAEIHERKRAPIYMKKEVFRRFFQDLRAQNLAKIYQARTQSGQSVAAQLVLLGKHPVCHTACAGSHKDSLSLGSTPFLRWKAFEALSQLGYQANDLTGAILGPVTRFKSHLGGELNLNICLKQPESRAVDSFLFADRVVNKIKKVVGLKQT